MACGFFDDCEVVRCRQDPETTVQTDAGNTFEMCDGCAEERVARHDDLRYYDP